MAKGGKKNKTKNKAEDKPVESEEAVGVEEVKIDESI